MIARSTNMRSALRARQRGFFLNPYRFGGGRSEYLNAVLADSPAMYWRLDETTGILAADSSGNDRLGTYAADASTLTAAGLLTADSNKAISIFGGGNPVGVSRESFPVSLAQSWTFECIIKPVPDTAPAPNVGVLFQVGKPSTGDFWPELGIVHWGGGKFGYRVMRTAIAQLILTPALFSYGEVHHVLLRYKLSELLVELIVNNVVIASAPAAFTASTSRFHVGYCFIEGAPPSTFYGVIDEVAIYAGALPDAKIAEHYSKLL